MESHREPVASLRDGAGFSSAGLPGCLKMPSKGGPVVLGMEGLSEGCPGTLSLLVTWEKVQEDELIGVWPVGSVLTSEVRSLAVLRWEMGLSSCWAHAVMVALGPA